MFTPRRLFLLAGLAASGLIGCSSTTKTADAPPAAPPAAQPAAQPQPAQAPAPRAAQAVGRPADQTNWNGTPATEAGKPGAYVVINEKVSPVPTDVKLGDKATVARIIDEGKNRNRVMDHITHITQKIGPRLTGSSNVETANRWAMEQFKSWGLESELFQWGEIPVRFDRLPSSAKIGSTRSNGEFRTLREMEFTSLAWGAGTDGPVRGNVLKMPENEEQFKAIESKLKGSWILVKSAGPGGRRGVGSFAGGMSARQGFFKETRKKIAAGELTNSKPDSKPETKPESKPEAKPDAPAPEGIAGYWDGRATGGPIPDGGTPFNLDLKLADGKVTGTMAYPNFHSGPIKDAKWDDATKTLTFAWESPAGASNYTFKLNGQKVSGESKLPPEIGGAIVMDASRGETPKETKTASSESTGPSIEERVFMAAPAGYISASSDERVRTSSIGGWRTLTPETLPKDVEIQVRQSDYDYMNSRLADGGNLEVEINCAVKFTPGPIPVYNTIAEIKGTELPDEVVIVSAHLDSWNGPGSQGTTDNGTGSSVTIEAARILAAAKAKPKRTIRFILWTGEEQGLLGSAGYVKMLKEKDLLKNISACFVDDGGTNYEGGLQVMDSQLPFFAVATAPVNGQFWSSTDQRFLDVNLRPTNKRLTGRLAGGGSDHQSFVNAGVPGYFWDEVGRAEYGYGWHTQNDKLDLAIPEYLMQSSTCAAVTAYNMACAPTLLPRDPLAKPDEKKPDQAASAAEK